MLFTKADLITTYELKLLDGTECGLLCDRCREHLPTEGDFARHFVIPDAKYLNLGDCPHSPTAPKHTINAGLRLPSYLIPTGGI